MNAFLFSILTSFNIVSLTTSLLSDSPLNLDATKGPIPSPIGFFDFKDGIAALYASACSMTWGNII